MTINRYLTAALVLLALIPGLALADNAVMEELGSKAAKSAMEQLNVEKGDANVLILTDAGHAIVDGQTTQAAIKGLTEESGNSIGDGNLFQVLRAYWKPLWFYFFNKATGEAVFMQVDNSALNKSPEEFNALSDDQIFSRISIANVDLGYMLNNTDDGNATFAGAFNGNEFALVGMSNVWAEGGSFDFMQATCFHDHLCPGVTSGYMLAKYVEEKLPINGSSESYKVIACRPWCKDDMLQMRWDATPGKSGMFVMALTDAEVKALAAKYNQSDVAGIYIRWNSSANQGDALALTFNWTKVYELTGTGTDVWTGPAWGSKLVMDMEMMPFYDQPEAFVSTIKEFSVDADKLAQLQNAGMHPLKVAGVM
jgi:formylmethanofuran dehydrogenase subunit E-like metal-binding protein